VRYAEDALVLLAAFDESGAELSYAQLCDTADRLGWRMAKRHGYESVSQLLAEAQDLPADEEGFVVRFDDGARLKIKGALCQVRQIDPLTLAECRRAVRAAVRSVEGSVRNGAIILRDEDDLRLEARRALGG
jgi:hypothetical protein